MLYPIGFTEKESPVEGLNTNPVSLSAIFFKSFIIVINRVNL